MNARLIVLWGIGAIGPIATELVDLDLKSEQEILLLNHNSADKNAITHLKLNFAMRMNVQLIVKWENGTLGTHVQRPAEADLKNVHVLP